MKIKNYAGHLSEDLLNEVPLQILHEGPDDLDGSCSLAGGCDLCVEAGNRSVEIHARVNKYRE